MRFTVFGGTGFIGSNLIRHLRREGHEVYAPHRGELVKTKDSLGHVIYAIGLTGDFRKRPYDTVEAHVCLLSNLLRNCVFDSWLYLSSTRIYSQLPLEMHASEEAAIPLTPGSDSIYDLSKLLGESLCLTHPSPTVRVARLSNVYGVGQSKHTFLASVLHELYESGKAQINESPKSCKDYVAIDDVLPLLQAIATCGKRRIYNVASGHLTTHAAVAERLVSLMNAELVFTPDGPMRAFPPINIDLATSEFQYSPARLLDQLDALLPPLQNISSIRRFTVRTIPSDPISAFEAEKLHATSTYSTKKQWQNLSSQWLVHAFQNRYMYHFESLGRPIIQTPVDMVATQELIWKIKPDLIIETGIAHGGSLIMSASMLSLIDYCEAVEAGTTLDPKATHRRVLGLDIDIRPHNRVAIEAHPMAHRIDMIEGSSVAPEIIAKVHAIAKNYKKILVCLDSNHTHEHVLAELEAYAPLVSAGSYCCVFDTVVEDLPDDMFPDRPWGSGNNPKTAVWEYLRCLKSEGRQATDGAALAFEIDHAIEDKLMITVAPDGYLKRI